MFTEEQVRAAAERQPERYILHLNAEGVLIGFGDLDSGVEWVPLREDTGELKGWLWVS